LERPKHFSQEHGRSIKAKIVPSSGQTLEKPGQTVSMRKAQNNFQFLEMQNFPMVNKFAANRFKFGEQDSGEERNLGSNNDLLHVYSRKKSANVIQQSKS